MSVTYKPWEMAASHPPKLHDCWRVRLQPPCVGGRYSHPTQARRLTRRLENWVSHLPIHWRVDVGRFLVLEEPSLFEGSRRTYINTAIRAILCIDTIALEEGSRGCTLDSGILCMEISSGVVHLALGLDLPNSATFVACSSRCSRVHGIAIRLIYIVEHCCAGYDENQHLLMPIHMRRSIIMPVMQTPSHVLYIM